MMSDSEATTPETGKSSTAAPTTKPGKAKRALKKSAKPKAKRAARKPATKKPAAKKAAPKKAALKKAQVKRPAVKRPAVKRVAPKAKVELSRVPNKAEFIRRFPNLPAKEVVARAKELGATLTESYVYNTRGLQKHGKNPKRTPMSYGKGNIIHLPSSFTSTIQGSRRAHPEASQNGQSLEGLLQAVASELGLSNAIRHLQAVRTTVAEAMGTLPPF